MSYHTKEHVIARNASWKKPSFTRNRVYRTKNDAMRRISWLAREFGYENVVHEPSKNELNTEVVYIRL